MAGAYIRFVASVAVLRWTIVNDGFIISLGMAQQLKVEVKERMEAAGARVFARAGYRGATMAAIAREAGVSTGNLYRYFESKDVLFDVVVTEAIAEDHLGLLRRRVGSLVRTEDLTRLDPAAQRDGEALLAFWVAHREVVVVLLAGAEGTPWEGYRDRFVQALMKPSTAALRERAGSRRLPAVIRRTLERVFENTAQTLVSILRENETEDAIREAFAAFWSYQLGGLRGLQEWVSHGS